jgi:hypothetical protein
MTRTVTFALFAAMLLSPGGAAPLGAQAAARGFRTPVRPLAAVALSDLTFGTVLPGIPATIGVLDHRHAALFQVEGPADATVRIELVLPSALAGAGGALLPIAFGPGDGFADFSRGQPPRGTSFDPNGPLLSTLGPNGRLWVRLGGTVLPGRPQAGGWYSGTIFVTVYDLGS